MNRLQCLGKSSKASQKQHSLEVNSTHISTNKPDRKRDTTGQKVVIDKHRRSLPAHALSHFVQDSGSRGVKEQCAREPASEGSINITPGVEEHAAPVVLPMKDPRKPQSSDSVVTGEKIHAPPPIEPFPPNEPQREGEKTEEDEEEDEGRGAPLELMAEFLGAVMGREYELASKLCQMILIYEPENPEAGQFLPLIQEKVLEEQEEEQSNEDDDEAEDDGDEDGDDSSSSREDDDSDDSGSDEESPQSPGCSPSPSSSSSSSSSGDDEEEEKRGSRHKPCPSSNIPQ